MRWTKSFVFYMSAYSLDSMTNFRYHGNNERFWERWAKNRSSFCLLLSCWTVVYENTSEIYWLIDLDLVSFQSDRGLGFGFCPWTKQPGPQAHDSYDNMTTHLISLSHHSSNGHYWLTMSCCTMCKYENLHLFGCLMGRQKRERGSGNRERQWHRGSTAGNVCRLA